jgi:hypothetical protein
MIEVIVEINHTIVLLDGKDGHFMSLINLIKNSTDGASVIMGQSLHMAYQFY